MAEGYKLIHFGNEMNLDFWLNHVLFSWKWWMVVGLTILPWVLFFYFFKKEKRKQYFISALILMISSSFLDIAGLSYDLWRYYVKAVPVMGGFFPWNFSIIPFFYMISFEIFPEWPKVVKAIMVALLFAYIGEPIMDYIGFTSHHDWKHSYSIPFYFALYLIAYYGGVFLSKNNDESIMVKKRSEMELIEKQKQSLDKYHYAFEHSFDAIYLIEKKHTERNFRFTEVNDTFCKEMGYTREEMMALDPRLISDQKTYNVDIKYRPLLKKGKMEIDTTFVKKSGELRYVNLRVKVFWRKDKIEILSIVNFLEDKMEDMGAN
jgi:PAS domain S-box-containing protein